MSENLAVVVLIGWFLLTVISLAVSTVFDSFKDHPELLWVFGWLTGTIGGAVLTFMLMKGIH